jgi:hypothetical protein
VNLKLILLASVTALTSAFAAQAADAIVAAEPEPMEYVRVCDAFGAGYFYIPGTETCLRVGGYIRTEGRFGRDRAGTSDWSAWTRAQITFSAKTDTDLGALTSVVTLRGNAESSTNRGEILNEAYIDVAGFRIGHMVSWWDDDPSGETDVLASNSINHNSIRYTYKTDTWSAAVTVDELEDAYQTKPDENPNNIGVNGQVSAKYGALSAIVLAGYDVDTEEVAIRGIGYADIGPGQLGVYGVWASGVNYYYEEAEWTVGAQYELKLNDKWAVIPGAQYFQHTEIDSKGEGFTGGDAWTAGVTVNYKVVENLTSKLSLQYQEKDGEDDQVRGFLRLQSNF